MTLLTVVLFVLCGSIVNGLPVMVSPNMVDKTVYRFLYSSNQSSVYEVLGSRYVKPPLLFHTTGTRFQIGYGLLLLLPLPSPPPLNPALPLQPLDYAALLHSETSNAFDAFLASTFSLPESVLLRAFLDYCWSSFLEKRTPDFFLQELAGMKQWHVEHAGAVHITSDEVARSFYTVANMPADPANIVAMLEEELEPASWPRWLKDAINDIIAILEKMAMGCDAYAVWGSRTQGPVRSSRNLDWQTNTGIDEYKLITVFDNIQGAKPGSYATMGFTVGLGALAGMSDAGVSVSEMNLDNNVVTFNGLAFPLRLRFVLEQATSLSTAMSVWNATNNTNSFNFLIASASDGARGSNAAYALETIRGFTQQYGANSPVEAAATYQCDGSSCSRWTNQTGAVRIGFPLPEAVWRSNHAFSPKIMQTQEPLFNDTVFRYNLQHDLINELTGTVIDDKIAVAIVATLGTKGVNFLTCNQDFAHGENVMSIAYTLNANGGPNYFYIAWEQGKGSKMYWTPAACNDYIRFDFSSFKSISKNN